LSRYVAVSDDVTDSGRKHAPLLFTITEEGRMDPSPVPIDGIAELNDPESITEGPGGTLFVCTSHSVNAHGHLPESRRRLLHLALLPDRRAKILGQIDLTTARTNDGGLAWGQERTLDIEAIAFRGGALYIGLKSPLTADGSATILRLPEAVAIVKSGVVPRGALSVWARMHLCVARGGATVCEGIADLAFLPDGGLLVAANSPKGMPSDGGGSLWKLPASGPPALLERFDGLKPEGVTLSPDRSTVVVVFDRDGRPPLWLKRPLSP
jgi:hypothetical protein